MTDGVDDVGGGPLLLWLLHGGVGGRKRVGEGRGRGVGVGGQETGVRRHGAA